MKDYHNLSQFHYRESRSLPPPRKIFVMHRTDIDELVGVIVYSYSPLACFGRSKALAGKRLTIKELNEQFSLISRVVLHPKYRTIGLGARLVKETLPHAGTHYVEAIAVMAKYNPFFEKAGMKKLVSQNSNPEFTEATHDLSKLGFNLYLLASEKHNRAKLKKLSNRQESELKGILARIKHPRLRRTFGNKPYMDDNTYVSALENASQLELAMALRVLSILMQKKVYLFWTST